MNKETRPLIVTLILLLATQMTFVWMIVEFFLYLFKDRSFCWWSVIVFTVSVIAYFWHLIAAFITDSWYNS